MSKFLVLLLVCLVASPAQAWYGHSSSSSKTRMLNCTQDTSRKQMNVFWCDKYREEGRILKDGVVPVMKCRVLRLAHTMLTTCTDGTKFYHNDLKREPKP